MVSSHRIPAIAILCIFIVGHSASMSLGKGEGEAEESNKNWHRKEGVQSKKWCPSRKFFYALFSGTQSFLLGLSWSSDNITVTNKKSTSKKQPTNASEKITSYLHKNIIIPLLCQCGLFIHTCVSINSKFSTSFDVKTWYGEAVIYTKSLLFSHSIVS